MIQAAIAVRYPLIAVCATPQWQARYPDLWTRLETLTARQEIVSPEVLAAIATTTTPDGIVAIAAQQPDQSPAVPPGLGIALENLQDPGNLGTLIRTAAAVGCDGLWLSAGSVDLTHPKVLRASAGQWFRVPKQVVSDLPGHLITCQQQGAQVLATAVEGAVPHWSVDFTQPTVLVLGNEGAGLSADLVAIATQVISIPMVNAVESLNVGVAAAVILFEALRQRRSGG